jgi:hypothetical protein
MTEVRRWFEEAQAIADEVERGQAMCDLAFDAQSLAQDGRQDEAIALAEYLLTLDRDDDLLSPAIQGAEDLLLALGVRHLSPLQEVIDKLQQKFTDLSPRGRLIAVAKALAREHARRYPQAWAEAAAMVDAAAALAPLDQKEQRFRAETMRHQDAMR